MVIIEGERYNNVEEYISRNKTLSQEVLILFYKMSIEDFDYRRALYILQHIDANMLHKLPIPAIKPLFFDESETLLQILDILLISDISVMDMYDDSLEMIKSKMEVLTCQRFKRLFHIVNEELLRRSRIMDIRSHLELLQFSVIQDLHKIIISK